MLPVRRRTTREDATQRKCTKYVPLGSIGYGKIIRDRTPANNDFILFTAYT